MANIRTMTEDILLEIGGDPSYNGFGYIVEAMELIDENPSYKYQITDLYKVIAKKRNSTHTAVERAIRYAKETILTKGDLENVEKYFPSIQGKFSNAKFLMVFHLKIKRNMEGESRAD